MGWPVNIAGIDYSTRAVDVVLVPLDRGASNWHRFPLAGQDAFDRTRTVANVVPGRASVFWDSVLAVGIEHPGGTFGTREMTRVQGAILACIPDRLLVEPWPPAKWRTAVGMAGNASKLDVLKWVMANAFEHGWKTDEKLLEQDACDAYCIALATRQAIRTTKVA